MNAEPFGLCQCGCGEQTATRDGRPRRFRAGHNVRMRGELWVVTDTGYETPCWLWSRGLQSAGYAKRTLGHGSTLVHRQHYEAKYGPVPVGLDLDHLCRVRHCVNPDHVEPATRAVNARRGAKTKLTLAQVEDIRRSTESDRVLAIRYDVAPGTIWNARSGPQWRAA